MVETTAMVKLPPRLAEQARTYVRLGLFPDLDALLAEALRRYIETHQIELLEDYIRQDVEWGLHGHD